MNVLPKTSKQVLFLFGGMLVAGELAVGMIDDRLPAPICGLRRFTGIPCPFCGSTRSLAALMRFKWSEAFLFNPFIFLTCMSIVLWLGLWVLDRSLQKQRVTLLQQKFERLPWFWIIFTAILLNWIYLYWRIGRAV